eukprot:133067_1
MTQYETSDDSAEDPYKNVAELKHLECVFIKDNVENGFLDVTASLTINDLLPNNNMQQHQIFIPNSYRMKGLIIKHKSQISQCIFEDIQWFLDNFYFGLFLVLERKYLNHLLNIIRADIEAKYYRNKELWPKHIIWPQYYGNGLVHVIDHIISISFVQTCYYLDIKNIYKHWILFDKILFKIYETVHSEYLKYIHHTGIRYQLKVAHSDACHTKVIRDDCMMNTNILHKINNRIIS